MRPRLIPTVPVSSLAAVLALVLLGTQHLWAADVPLKFEAFLIWGTNDGKSPDPSHKPVEPAIRKKLKELPLKWTNFFEVNRKVLDVQPGGVTRVSLSRECVLEVKHNSQATVEVSLIGRGNQVLRRTQALPKGETLVLGGDAPNATAWLVVLRRID